MPCTKYLVDRNTKKKYCINGLVESDRLPEKEKLRQKFSNHKVVSSEQLPPNVDFRLQMTPIEDQSQTNSCVSNSFAGVYEYIIRKTNGSHIDVSRLFIHYNARAKNINLAMNMIDSGVPISTAIEVLEEYGTCLESVWPFDIPRLNQRPSDEAFEAARNNIITDALKLEINLEEMKSCLAQGYPFVFGIYLFKSFSNAAKKGIVPTPTPTEEALEVHGSHAMVAVGYSDRSRAFIVRNSWGEQWGYNGYCFISYDYMTNPKYCFDVWTVRHIDIDDLGHEDWGDDPVNHREDDDNENNNDDDYDIEEDDDKEEEANENNPDEQKQEADGKLEVQEQGDENNQDGQEQECKSTQEQGDENNQDGQEQKCESTQEQDLGDENKEETQNQEDAGTENNEVKQDRKDEDNEANKDE